MAEGPPGLLEGTTMPETNFTLARLMGAASLSALMLTGCTVGPDYHPPQMPTPAKWAKATIGPTTAPSTAPSTQSVTTDEAMQIAEWWIVFNDPMLDSLVSRAVQSNLSLKQAESRIRQARAARGVASAGLWPTLDASGSWKHSGGGPGYDHTVKSGGRDLFQTGLDATWELDVFGGVRRQVESANADIQAAIEDRRDVLVSQVAEVALNYMDLRSFQQQIIVANRNLKDQEHNADIAQRQFSAGFVSRLDVANANAEVATTRSQIPLLEASAQQAIYNIALLLGREPAALDAELSGDGPIPPIPPEVPIGLPSDLLRRRPDIRMAEAKLHSATANIGVATADLFPKFSLTGSVGLSASKFESLVNWDNRSYSIGPTVNWNVFDAGKIRYNIQVQNALQEQALLTYEQTVLTALNDVQAALVAYAKEQQHRRSLQDAVTYNRQAVELAMRQYTGGTTDFLNVITAQRSLLSSEDALVQSTRTLATNLISLYKALGGGWEHAEPAPTTRPAQ
jgi:NodT family efflux transporter outer membrane factor (OMF) lipoprotein